MRHVSSTLSWRVKRVLSPRIASSSSTSYGVGASPPSLGELHVERDRLRAARVGAVGVEDHPRAGRGVELDHELVGLGPAVPVFHEAEAGGMAEDDPQLGLGDGQLLAGADEPRHPRPAPVVDLQAHRGVGLGGGVLGDAVDVEVAVVLPAHVVRRVGVGGGAEDGVLGVLERLGVVAGGRLHRGHGDELHQVVDDHVAHARRRGRRSARGPPRRSSRPS